MHSEHILRALLSDVYREVTAIRNVTDGGIHRKELSLLIKES